MPFHIPITGRLIDPVTSSGISGAQVWFLPKATSRGTENVTKSQGGYFTTDDSGYYSASIASGWYKIDYLAPGALDVERLGVATVSGVETLDLGTLIANSIPPPSELGQISDVDLSGRINGGLLAWSQPRQKWVSSLATGQFATSGQVAKKAGTIYHSITPAGNAGGATFTDLISQSIAANTLQTNGDRLRITSVFTTVSGDRDIRAHFGGTLVYDVMYTEPNLNASFPTWNGTGAVRPTSPLNVVAEIMITRTGAAGQNVWSVSRWDDFDQWRAFHLAPCYTGTQLDLTSAQVFKFSASGAGANNITQREMLIEYIPAP